MLLYVIHIKIFGVLKNFQECNMVLSLKSLRTALLLHRCTGFLCGSAGKESACDAEDLDLIPGLGRSPGEGKVYPRQYSGLENSMDCIVHGVSKSWTRLSNFHLHLTTFALCLYFF